MRCLSYVDELSHAEKNKKNNFKKILPEKWPEHKFDFKKKASYSARL